MLTKPVVDASSTENSIASRISLGILRKWDFLRDEKVIAIAELYQIR